MRDLAITNCIAKRQDNMVLTKHFCKLLWAITTIKRLIRGVCHVWQAYRSSLIKKCGSLGFPTVGFPRDSVRRPSWLRHKAQSTESCCLPTLTRFTVCCCAGPSRRTDRRARRPRYPAPRITREGCESGRIGTPGERVSRKGPWVQIPLPPPHLCELATVRCISAPNCGEFAEGWGQAVSALRSTRR